MYCACIKMSTTHISARIIPDHVCDASSDRSPARAPFASAPPATQMPCAALSRLLAHTRRPPYATISRALQPLTPSLSLSHAASSCCALVIVVVSPDTLSPRSRTPAHESAAKPAQQQVKIREKARKHIDINGGARRVAALTSWCTWRRRQRSRGRERRTRPRPPPASS